MNEAAALLRRLLTGAGIEIDGTVQYARYQGDVLSYIIHPITYRRGWRKGAEHENPHAVLERVTQKARAEGLNVVGVEYCDSYKTDRKRVRFTIRQWEAA